jgi:hypothetical protein
MALAGAYILGTSFAECAERQQKWVRTLGPVGGFRGVDIVIDGNADAVVAYEAAGSPTNLHAVKCASGDGQTMWERTVPYHGFPDHYGKPHRLALDPDGNAVLAWGATTNWSQASLSKLAAGSGATLWEKKPSAYFHDMTLDAQGNVLFAASLGYGNMPGSKFHTLRYSPDGTQTTAHFHTTWVQAPPDKPPEWYDYWPQAIAASNDGGIVVGGYASYWMGEIPHNDKTLIKLSAGGGLVWTAGARDEVFERIVVDSSSSVIVTGTTSRTSPTAVPFFRKYSAGGELVWQIPMPGHGVRDLKVAENGSIFLLAQVPDSPQAPGGGARIIKFNIAGGREWEAPLIGPGATAASGSAIVLDSAGHVVVAGSVVSSPGNTDLYVAMIDVNNGTQSWFATFDSGAAALDSATRIAVDGAGNIVVAGVSNKSGTSSAIAVCYGVARFLVPVEGGIRAAAKLMSSIPADLEKIRAFVDANDDGDFSAGESSVMCDVVMQQDTDGSRKAYFTPPPFSRLSAQSPDADGQEVLLQADTLVLEDTLHYTADVAEGVDGVEAGMKAALTEALDRDLIGLALLPPAAQAGATAETILAQIFRRALPIAEAGATEQRTQIARKLEAMPIALRDHLNAGMFAMSSHAAVVLPVNYGHSQNRPLLEPGNEVILTLGTGTLALCPAAQAPPPQSAALSGGRVMLPKDFGEDGGAFPISEAEGLGWKFTAVMDKNNGLQIHDLEVRPDNAQLIPRLSMEKVARLLSTPSISLAGDYGKPLDLPHLSHVYLNSGIPSGLDRGGHSHASVPAWIVTATFRVPLDGAPLFENIPHRALVARQSFTCTAPFSEFEPTHSLISANLFPQVTFSISDPGGPGTLPAKVDITHRLAFNPQEGRSASLPEEYYWGLFKDKDYPSYWMTTKIPAAEVVCQPVPLWWNLFENSAATQPNVILESLFDTDPAPALPTPDNIHLHHVHTAQHLMREARWISGLGHTEAPGSFDGTLHMHWRWAAAFGEEFGGGTSLLPPRQQWVMGIARAGFPLTFQNFRDHLSENTDLGLAEKVLLVRCEQSGVTPARQYYTLTPGLTYALGVQPGAAGVDFGLSLGGYSVISGYPDHGWSESSTSLAFRSAWEALLQTLYALQETPIELANPVLDALLSRVAIYPGKEECLEHELHGRDAGHGAPGGSGGGGVEYRTVSFPPNAVGTVTPLTLAAEGVSVTFSTAAGGPGFFVGENIFLEAPGFTLLGTPGSGAGLTVSFTEPVREIRNLPVALKGGAPAATLTLNALSGAASVATQVISLIPQGDKAVALVSLSSAAAFDSFTLTSSDPLTQIAIGGFHFSPVSGVPGDLNLNGNVDGSDLTLLLTSYTGPTGQAPFWSRSADLDNDLDVDDTDYQLLLQHLETPGPAAAIVVSESPAACLPPVSAGDTVSLSVIARDLAGGTLQYAWSADVGTFTPPNSPGTVWKAPSSLVDSYSEIPLSLVITSSGGGSRLLRVVQPLVRHPLYENWAASFQLSGAEAVPSADPDRDGLVNLLEFAVGRNPAVSEGESSLLLAKMAGTSGAETVSVEFLLPESPPLGIRYFIETAATLTPSGWSPIAVRDTDSAWRGSAAVTLQPSANGYRPITITDTLTASPRKFIRLRVSF